MERVYLPGVERAGVTHQRLLRAMDVLLRHQAAVETHVLRRLPAPTSVEVVFYDITTVRIHGEGEGERTTCAAMVTRKMSRGWTGNWP